MFKTLKTVWTILRNSSLAETKCLIKQEKSYRMILVSYWIHGFAYSKLILVKSTASRSFVWITSNKTLCPKYCNKYCFRHKKISHPIPPNTHSDLFLRFFQYVVFCCSIWQNHTIYFYTNGNKAAWLSLVFFVSCSEIMCTSVPRKDWKD